MDWTKPLSALLVLSVAALAVGGVVELLRTTLTGDWVVASVATLAVVGVFVAAAVGLGAKSRRWLANPDSYW